MTTIRNRKATYANAIRLDLTGSKRLAIPRCPLCASRRVSASNTYDLDGQLKTACDYFCGACCHRWTGPVVPHD